MNNKQLKQAHSIPANDHADLDVGAIVEQIWNDLRGRVSRSAVRQALLTILPKYENARIRRYIPILVRREALEMLRVELAKATPARPSQTSGKLSADTIPDGQTAKPSGLGTGLALPKNS